MDFFFSDKKTWFKISGDIQQNLQQQSPLKPDKKAYQTDGITHEKSDQAVRKRDGSTQCDNQKRKPKMKCRIVKYNITAGKKKKVEIVFWTQEQDRLKHKEGRPMKFVTRIRGEFSL